MIQVSHPSKILWNSPSKLMNYPNKNRTRTHVNGRTKRPKKIQVFTSETFTCETSLTASVGGFKELGTSVVLAAAAGILTGTSMGFCCWGCAVRAMSFLTSSSNASSLNESLQQHPQHPLVLFPRQQPFAPYVAKWKWEWASWGRDKGYERRGRNVLWLHHVWSEASPKRPTYKPKEY